MIPQPKHLTETVYANGAGLFWAMVCLLGLLFGAACTPPPKQGQAVTIASAHKNPSEGKSTASDRSPRPRQAPRDLLDRVQKCLDAFCVEHGGPGATFGFVLPDGRGGAVASGVSHKASGRAMRPTDRMFSGSIGKTYVAAVLLQLLEEGRVELDAKISHWFGEEEWLDRLPNGRELTLRMLMTHTSGIQRHLFMPQMQAQIKAHPQKVWRPEELVAFVLDTAPLFPAGKGWSYADMNYILVGMIIERVTGRTFYEEVTDRILAPLKLIDTFPSDRPDLPGLVSGYTSPDNIFSLPVEVASNERYAMNPQVEWTGGGFVSTALDLARWGQLLYGGRVLKGDSLRQMLDGVPTEEGSEHKYGLGAMIRPSKHGLAVGHLGWVPGYISAMAHYPDHGVTVAVQVNTDVGIGRAMLGTLLDDIASELLQP